MSKKLLIFDFFGVFCPDVADVFMKDHFTEEEISDMRVELYPDLDAGRLLPGPFFKILEERSGVPAVEIEKGFMDRSEVAPDMIKLVLDAKASGKYTVILLSNAYADHMDGIFKKYDLWNLFDRYFVSAKYGMCKPDVRFFELALKETGFEGKDATMIDDRQSNLDAAASLGMKGILFESCEKLRNNLGI